MFNSPSSVRSKAFIISPAEASRRAPLANNEGTRPLISLPVPSARGSGPFNFPIRYRAIGGYNRASAQSAPFSGLPGTRRKRAAPVNGPPAAGHNRARNYFRRRARRKRLIAGGRAGAITRLINSFARGRAAGWTRPRGPPADLTSRRSWVSGFFEPLGARPRGRGDRFRASSGGGECLRVRTKNELINRKFAAPAH